MSEKIFDPDCRNCVSCVQSTLGRGYDECSNAKTTYTFVTTIRTPFSKCKYFTSIENTIKSNGFDFENHPPEMHSWSKD